MQTPVAQLVALACHSNAACRDARVPAFFPSNSTTKFCDRIAFRAPKHARLRAHRLSTSVETPEEWMQLLLQLKCIGARVKWSIRDADDRMTAGFVGGGGNWMLETLFSEGPSVLWRPKWEVWNRNAAESRVWRVTYDAEPLKVASLGAPPDIDRCAQQIREALTDVLAFSELEHCDPFTQMFRDALGALDGKTIAYHRDLAPDGVLTDLEHRILHACQFAFVFGGMGSWNDMGFEGGTQDKYEAVSSKLFAVLCNAIPAAANGFLHRTFAA